MSPPAARHGNLQAYFSGELLLQGQKKGHGKVYTEAGIVLARKPDHVLGPDVAFVSSGSLPAQISSEGFLETIPELVVEIRSKNDAAAEIADKVADYLTAGVRLVWIVEPTTEIVSEHRPGQPPQSLGKSDTLRCDDIIPGFRLSVAELFRE